MPSKNSRNIINRLVELKLAELEIGSYGAYPSGRGYDGGLDRPLREPNPSTANPPKFLSTSPSTPAPISPDRSGKELYDLYKGFKGSTDDFYKGLKSQGEIDNFDIHRDSEVRRNRGEPVPQMPKGYTPPPSPDPSPPPQTSPSGDGSDPRLY